MKMKEVLDDLYGRFLVKFPIRETNNTERLLFQVEEAHWFYEDYYRRRYNLEYMNLKKFTQVILQHNTNITEEDIDEEFRKFIRYKATVPVFGALILDSTMTKIVLVKGFGQKRLFTFPRGKISKSETDINCAIREVYEEIGYDISQKVLSNVYIDLGSKTKESKLYAVMNVPLSTKFETQTRNEIQEIKWISISTIENTNIPTLSYIKSHIKHIKELIRRIEKEKTKVSLDHNRINKAWEIV
ncbi:mRNA-decapping enzyme subunit 2 [Nematocida sp. AWRm80]|nr:mRNA-decapping enzyme subunit 2 [Nematocida sp. AWRm80]